MHWYNGWLEEVTRRSLEAARRETRKPLAVMMGGPKVGPSQGISLGNVGPIVRLLGRHAPAFLNDTDAQTLFSGRYTRAACSQYGVNLMLENVGPPYLEVFHQYNMLLNVLSCGADTVHLAHWGELYDDKTWFGRTWAALGPLATRYRTVYRKSDAALFHSYLTSWYRPDRSNTDALRLYDSTNTLWHPDRGYPSWGRALASPDVVDDAMVEDGALRGRKLLVIPNGSVTVTSRKAVDAIRRWVEDGGTLVGFGSGCLAYTIESDRSLRATPGLAGMLPAAVAGAVRSAGRAGEEGTAGASAGTGTRRPASGSEGASASHGSSPAGPAAVRAASASGSPKAPRVSAQAGEDDLASGTGPRGAMPSSRGTPAATPAAPSSRRLGKGRVVLYPTPADPDRESAFVHQAMGFLAAEARGAGVRRWCDADGGPACDVNPLYCGRDQASGRHLFAIDLTRHARNGLRDAIFWTDRTFSLTFHPSLRGEAELVGITDSFTACAGGEARSDPAAHALVVRFRLPRPAGQPLRLTFGKSRSGLALAKHPLLLWDGEDLELRPTLGFGAPQTAEPIRVGADGSLSPEAISMPYLVHGEMHRGKFGRGPRFRLSPVAAGALLLRVNSVARAGAVLVVSVDGRELLRRDLPDKDAKNDPRAGEVAEAIRIPLPAGEHEVHVDNAGADWFSVDRYVFMGLR